MTNHPRPESSDQALRRALTTLGEPIADESAVDDAFKTLVHLVTPPAPQMGFLNRVMLAVRQAPLPEGRLVLAKPVLGLRMAALVFLAAITAYVTVVASGPFVTRLFVRTIALFVYACRSILMSLKTGVELWGTYSRVHGAVAEGLTSPTVVIMLFATTLVAVLSLTALARLLPGEQESSQW